MLVWIHNNTSCDARIIHLSIHPAAKECPMMDCTLTDFLRVLLGVQNSGSLKSFLDVCIACIEGFIQFIYSSHNLCEMGRAGLYLFATQFIPKPSLLRPLSSPQKNIPRKRIHFIIEDQLMKSPEVPYRQLMKVRDFSRILRLVSQNPS